MLVERTSSKIPFKEKKKNSKYIVEIFFLIYQKI